MSTTLKTQSIWMPFATRGFTWESIRWRAGVHYWNDCRALRSESKGCQRCRRSDFPFYDSRLGRKNSHGSISPYAMRSLTAMKDQFDICMACDTDHDRHGIVTRSSGLLPPNHYLAVVSIICSAIVPAGEPPCGRKDPCQQRHD